MSHIRPIVNNPSCQQVDASFSRTYLTIANFRGPSLLRTIKPVKEHLQLTPNTIPLHSRTSSRLDTDGTLAMVSSYNDKDILAAPLSSDEDESTKSIRQSPATEHSRKLASTDQDLQPRKRTIAPQASSRSSKRLKSTHEEASRVEEKNINFTVPDDELFRTWSQSSTGRSVRGGAKPVKYGSQSSSQAGLAASTFQSYGSIPLTPKKNEKYTGFVQPGISPISEKKRSPTKNFGDIEPPGSSGDTSSKPVTFRMPDEVDIDPLSSATTAHTDQSPLEALKALTQSPRRRSSSTSSLSSARSSVLDTFEAQSQFMLNSDGLKVMAVDSVHCPICRRYVDKRNVDLSVSPSALSLRQQQDFCFRHRMKDAQTEWKESGYPSIDWEELTKVQAVAQIKGLLKVLRRERSSFFLDTLESKVKEAKGNQSKINTYFRTDVIDMVKHGYYGPKGAKVLTEVISNDKAIQKLLSKQLRTDKTMRAVGVGGIVAAVLLPELTQSLVMEDMNISDQAKAREILDESTNVGMLLNPDDDYVAKDDEFE